MKDDDLADYSETNLIPLSNGFLKDDGLLDCTLVDDAMANGIPFEDILVDNILN